MYEQYFELNNRPFRSSATGTDIFVGPQIAAAVSSLRRALAAQDAIVTVTGPVGSGKTTLVVRALESIGESSKVIDIARMRLNSDDVLDFLLSELDAQKIPVGTIQKFALFRRHLQKLSDNDIRVFIIVEDGVRLGAETLAEVEALTAADAGPSEGAGIVLMGDQNLDSLVAEDKLARVQQRIRRRCIVTPLDVSELRGYLKHCFRLAGREFDELFEANSAELLHRYSKGIPRITNNLVESSLTATMAQQLQQVSFAMIVRVAEKEYGLDTDEPGMTQQPVIATAIATAPVPIAEAARMSSSEPEPVKQVAPEPMPEPVVDVDALPELIPDTQPGLEILEPDPIALSAVEDIQAPSPDPDPTIAELKPDLAALELAIGADQNNDIELELIKVEPEPDQIELIPEITLDHAIGQRIEKITVDEPDELSSDPAGEISSTPETGADVPDVKLPPKRNKKSREELQKIAAQLANAKSIEDVDDRLAETLFGDELSLVAAQFAKNPETIESANDDLEVAASNEAQVAVGANGADAELNIEVRTHPANSGPVLTETGRIRTVQALNAESRPTNPAPQVSSEPQEVPQNRSIPLDIDAQGTIEDQLDSPITQTLKVLGVVPPVSDPDPEVEKSKPGFLSIFKR